MKAFFNGAVYTVIYIPVLAQLDGSEMLRYAVFNYR